MDSKELLKFLIRAYKKDSFEVEINRLLAENPESRLYLAKIIAALSGVEIDFLCEDFAKNLKAALQNYDGGGKVVIRVKDCNIHCTLTNNKTSCQAICPFDAIEVDNNKHTTFVNNNKCTDCGFCVEACPNNNYIDRSEALPLLYLLS